MDRLELDKILRRQINTLKTSSSKFGPKEILSSNNIFGHLGSNFLASRARDGKLIKETNCTAT